MPLQSLTQGGCYNKICTGTLNVYIETQHWLWRCPVVSLSCWLMKPATRLCERKLIIYKQSCKDARPQSRCAVKRNACQTITDHHTSPVGTTELCRAYSALIALGIMLAGIPCWRTSYLPKSVNPYRVQIHIMNKIIAWLFDSSLYRTHVKF